MKIMLGDAFTHPLYGAITVYAIHGDKVKCALTDLDEDGFDETVNFRGEVVSVINSSADYLSGLKKIIEPMRTLFEITTAARLNDEVTMDEMRYCIAAYDVMVSRLRLGEDQVRLKEYFKAADCDVRKYCGEEHDPNNADAVAWYRAFSKVGG